LWRKIWDKSSNDNELIIKVWQEIENAYSKKVRYYHNLNHISKMLASSNHYKSNINDLKTLQLAIFYHDIVYSAKQKDNEEKSAMVAEKTLLNLKYPENLIEKCKQFILATKNHANFLNNSDLNYFLDFDLEILSAPWDEYLNYTQQIRKEYKIFPDILYKPGRKKVLEHFLNLDNIYKTKEYHDKFESLARQNLKQEIELLH
jgi:predicted metal-dependent HD superfamily phosphohydrolase